MYNQGDIAINESEIKKLMLDIIDCGNNINEIFNKIDDLMSETKSYYDCESADSLRNKYSLFRENYNIIVKNIMSYSDDLLYIKNKYNVSMNDLSEKIKKDAVDVLSLQREER